MLLILLFLGIKKAPEGALLVFTLFKHKFLLEYKLEA